MSRLLPVVFLIQKILLVSSYWISRWVIAPATHGSIDWVVGPVETASMVHQIAQALPSSFSVSFSESAYYEHDYDYTPDMRRTKRFRKWHKMLVGPLLLGRLMVRARGFLYVSPRGFLLEELDEREFEFRFLKSKGKRLGLYWCGSEIRSPRLMHELEESMGLPNVFTYIGNISPRFETAAHERRLRLRAEIGDKYADVMFDNPTDQKSYLTGYREPFFYFMSPAQLEADPRKFDDLSRIVITHATTSPVIKGTPLVRAAVAKLRAEGYDFEYVELIGVAHAIVTKQLSRTHIALNQFYGFTTAVFGVEAMAARCALLSSADETIETTLPPGTNQASLVTKHWQIYDNLKSLLDHPERIKPLADAGHDWARRYASRDSTGSVLKEILDSVLDGSYDPGTRSRLSVEEVYGTGRPPETARTIHR